MRSLLFRIVPALAFGAVVLRPPALAGSCKHDAEPDGSDLPEALFPCGPASMAIICRLLDVPVADQELASIADRNGSSTLRDLELFAARKGLHCAALRLTPGQLGTLSNVAVLWVRTFDTSHPQGEPHFVVCVGPARNGSVHILDPSAASGLTGPVPLGQLSARWTGETLVISRDALPSPSVEASEHASRLMSFWMWLILPLAPVASFAMRRLALNFACGEPLHDVS